MQNVIELYGLWREGLAAGLRVAEFQIRKVYRSDS